MTDLATLYGIVRASQWHKRKKSEHEQEQEKPPSWREKLEKVLNWWGYPPC